jgi:hypothetical protein
MAKTKTEISEQNGTTSKHVEVEIPTLIPNKPTHPIPITLLMAC